MRCTEHHPRWFPSEQASVGRELLISVARDCSSLALNTAALKLLSSAVVITNVVTISAEHAPVETLKLLKSGEPGKYNLR